MRIRSLVSAVAAAALAAASVAPRAARADSPWSWPIQELYRRLEVQALPSASTPEALGVELRHTGTAYDAALDQTVFSYTVDLRQGAAEDLAVFVLGARCDRELVVAAPAGPRPEWSFEPHERFSGATGFRHRGGQDSSQASRDYVLRLAGRVGTGAAVTSGLVTRSGYATVTGPGPDCEADDDYLVPAGWSAPAQALTVECSDPAASPPDASASDRPATPDDLVRLGGSGSEAGSARCPQARDLVRTFRAVAPSSGLVTVREGLVHVRDTRAPDFGDEAALDRLVVLECGVDAPPPQPDPLANLTDACQPDPSALIVKDCNTTTAGACPGESTFVRTWTVTDECGNSRCLTYTEVTADRRPPRILGVPAGHAELECDGSGAETAAAQLALLANVSYFDECSPDGNLTASPPVRVAGACGLTYQVQRAWRAEDACGNVASAFWAASVVDTTPPAIRLEGGSDSAECGQEPDLPDAFASDACTPPAQLQAPAGPLLTASAPADGRDGRCARVDTYTWRATDDCGLESTASFNVTVRDTTAPVVSVTPSPCGLQDGQCLAAVVAACPLSVCARDACGFVNVTFAQAVVRHNSTGCPDRATVTRTYTATDDCNLSSTVVEEAEVADTTAPVFSEPARPDRTDPFSQAPQLDAAPAATDNCGSAVAVADHHTRVGSVIRYAFSASDLCGNTAWMNYTVTLQSSP